MDQPNAEVHRVVDSAVENAVENIARIVRRDGGALDVRGFDAASGELVVAFRQAADDECTTCTIDEPMVRAFLEEAVRAQGVELTALHIQSPAG